MKQVFFDRVVNVPGTDVFESIFLFERLKIDLGKRTFGQLTDSVGVYPAEVRDRNDKTGISYCFIEGIGQDVPCYRVGEVMIFMLEELLQSKKNEAILEKIVKYPAMWSEVYSPKDEFELFSQLCEFAFREKKKIHIIGVTLGEEIDLLEKYYAELGFFDVENNTFKPDFSLPLVSVSVKIENIMWRGSDYKRLGKRLFLCPPIREAGQVKALFKGINRGVIAGIYFTDLTDEVQTFLQSQIVEEAILPVTMAKLLKYNLEVAGLAGDVEEVRVRYE